MKVIMRDNGFEVTHDGSDKEKNYLQFILNRLIFVFDPTITTWDNGIRVEGKGRLRPEVIESIREGRDTTGF